MELEWDADKAAQNLKKHGVAFEDAMFVFYDSERIETYDGREDYEEDRWASLILRSCMWSTPFDTSTPSALSPQKSKCQRKKAIS